MATGRREGRESAGREHGSVGERVNLGGRAPLLFLLDAESAHELGLAALEHAAGSRWACGLLAATLGRRAHEPTGQVEVFGLRFPNRLGLAAGCDKDGRAVDALAALGFGFVEVGTVTPRPQPGNPRPRLFRLAEDGALVNRLGFNNSGAAAVAARLARRHRSGAPSVLGVNIGRNKTTPNERAADDYVAALRTLHAQGDYFVVNVSSPNTPGLRGLQDERELGALLRAVVTAEAELARAGSAPAKPVLVKLAPDLDDEAVNAAVAVAGEAGTSGIVATNTTIERPRSLRARQAAEAGGLSGRPLRERALEVVERVARRGGDGLPVIGVGGVTSAADVRRLLDAGAALVQLYTGFVYGGPGLPGRIARELASRR